jgi:UDP-N-acetylglucosamine--N-acetylmuramyl-(pentapeptide) pyrophosphoryl-undecaprenol N-acetylglucosamine transferase
MKIVITGGHHSSALVVAKLLVKKGHRVYWFGHKFSMWGDRNESAEYLEVTGERIPFFELKAGKYLKTLNPFKLVRLPLGFFQALWYLFKIRPELIVSFGGYLAVPVVIVGWLLRIPSVTHEQTVGAGMANKLISPFVRKIFISWSQTARFYPSGKSVLTGLPLRKEIFRKKTERYEFKERLPVVFVTGGKQGSHVINQVVLAVLPQFLENYNLIHQCGLGSLYQDYEEAKRRRDEIGGKKRRRYKVVDYIFPKEIGAVLTAADLIIGRAGAHIVYELAVLGKPALLIPLPWAKADEQRANARVLKKIGLAEILPQKDLSGESLLAMVVAMLGDIKRYQKDAARAAKLMKLNGAQKMIEEIEKILEGSR